MVKTFDEAERELFRAPHEAFVARRKELAAELKTNGDKASAAALTKLARPPISVWAVNQLWWSERASFDALFAAAGRVRRGDLQASAEHRKLVAQLRGRAATLLSAAGHSASEATLRRVGSTLAALAAAGDFVPDTPGALKHDRDPPGFEAMELAASLTGSPERREQQEPPRAKKGQHKRTEEKPERAEERKRGAKAEHRRAEEERKRAAEEERKKRRAERQRLEAELRTAERAVDGAERALDELRTELAAAESRVERARRRAEELTARLAELSGGDTD